MLVFCSLLSHYHNVGENLVASGGTDDADCAVDRRTARQFGAASAFHAAFDQRLPVSRTPVSRHDRVWSRLDDNWADRFCFAPIPASILLAQAYPGARVAPGSQVVTSDGSRLEMASADDRLTTSGPSRFTLPKSEHNGLRVRQDAGSLRYDVQSAPKRCFEVQTPHFSTVVKERLFWFP
jgi:hypothetical protein